jgi:D-alanine-D-alanine ligase
MKIAIVFNRESKRVINLFGVPNRENYGIETINRIAAALRKGGHQVKAFEGDKDLIDNLEVFMPQVISNERPGMVFNVSYGIQGQARYTHIPSILEMVGIPYIGSGPLAHSLSLDKVVTKMIFGQQSLPTPNYCVLEPSYSELPQLSFPLIVKPKNEAVSFGLRVVSDEHELKEAVQFIFAEFQQPVLVEEYIDGREINIGLLGNSPAEAFPPCEILFGETGPKIYTYEDKTHKSDRSISVQCPTDIDNNLENKAKQLAIKAFKALGCYDCARVDMRLTDDGQLYLLEINSLPSLGAHASYLEGAKNYGLDFTALVNRLVDVASLRYFGTAEQTPVKEDRKDPETTISNYIAKNRDKIEKTVKKWVGFSSRSGDSIGIRNILAELSENMLELGLLPVPEQSDGHFTWMWQTKAGYENGTILIVNIDVPLQEQDYRVPYRKESEWIFGEGIATSRGPLAIIEFTLRTLKHMKQLDKKRIGVIVYADEGLHCQYSTPVIKRATQRAAKVLVLRPSTMQNSIVIDRRGQRFYHLLAESESKTVEKHRATDDLITFSSNLLKEIKEACKPHKRTSVAMVKMETKAYTMHIPHEVKVTLLMNYASVEKANQLEKTIYDIVSKVKKGYRLVKYAERPPLPQRTNNTKLANTIIELAKSKDIALSHQSSAWPSAAGIIPANIPVVCGLGPYAKEIYTLSEAINRLSMIQRCLLIANFLALGK